MDCCQCQAMEELFAKKYVNEDLSRYLKKGPDKTTRMLIEAIQQESIEGLTLLDIGGGVGAIPHALLRAGVRDATGVDASAAYIRVAQAEAQRRNLAEKMTYHYGNFVDLAESIVPADIVTLDRVICCYPDMDKLVGLSAERARRIYGMVYPRNAWWSRAGEILLNLSYKIQRTPFRIFVHPQQAVEAILRRNGFKRRYYRQTLLWQVAVYTR